MADDNVTPVDFGKEHNEAVARFARLMGLVEEHHEDIRRHPVKHLQAASDEIVRLRLILRDAEDAYKRRRYRFQIDAIDQPTPTRREIETRVVTLDEYEALKAAYAVIVAHSPVSLKDREASE